MFTERISLGLSRRCSISGRRTKRIRQEVPAFSKVSADGANSTLKAAAGYSEGNIGIGGAIAVNVAAAKTNAIIGKDASVSMGGDLEIGAKADVHFGTLGDASGSKKAAGTGVGAGLGIAVTGTDTVAAVQDGAKISALSENDILDGVKITAVQTVADVVSAKAGSAGGNAITPVLALDITGSDAQAYLGALGTGSEVAVNGADAPALAVIFAKNDAAHQVAANASAAGGRVGA